MTFSNGLSEWCQKDLEYAQTANKPIYPVLIQSGTNIPDSIKDIRYIDMVDQISPESIELLLELVTSERNQRSQAADSDTTVAERQPTVFISYARADGDFAQRLTADLQKAGHKIWGETISLAGGEEWYEAIAEGIKNSYVIISVISPKANESKWVLREVLYADQMKKLIIPVQAQTANLPFHLIDRTVIDFVSDYADGLRQLLDALPAPGTSVSEIPPNVDLSSFELNSPLERDVAIKLLNAGWNVEPFALKVNEIIRPNAQADFVLTRDDINLAVVEVKGPQAELDRIKDRVRDYQYELDTRFAYVVHGDDVIEIDRSAGAETILNEFPKAQELWERSGQVVQSLLDRTVSAFDKTTQRRFAQLAAFDPPRIIFSLEDLRELWEVDNNEAISTIGKLKQASLVDEESEGVYRTAHQLVLEYAQKLLDDVKRTQTSSEQQVSLSDLRQIKVFLSSPGDVAAERGIAGGVIENLGDDPEIDDRARLELVSWDNTKPLVANMSPSGAINQRLPKPSDCDVMVVLLWSRMGTPLPFPEYQKADGTPYMSGTEWEFLDALQAASSTGKPKILVYRCLREITINPDDPQVNEKMEQHGRVRQFFESFREPDGSFSMGYNTYQNSSDFRMIFEQHMRAVIEELLKEA